MGYAIEADWHLLDTCNYRCDYCFFSPEMLGSKLRRYASPEQWRSAFDRSQDTWLLHITGGEPSAYPGFVELCEGITQNHFISINTNLTNPSLVRFAERVNPRRVNFINAGFHLEERERRSDQASFLRHADVLRRAGFSVLVSVVATPAALSRFEEIIALLDPIGLFPVPKLFRGMWNGQHYPESYDDRDKSRFRKFSELARTSYQQELARMDEPPSIDILNDDMFVDGIPTYTGLSCEAGNRFVYIASNGDVFRCGAKDFQGNLLNGTFVRTSGPAPCASTHCYYFCNKYADIQQSSGRTRSLQSPDVHGL